MKKIKRIIKKFIFKIFPQFKNISWNSIKNHKNNSDISEKSYIAEIYQIIHSKIDDYTSIATNSKISFTNIGKFCSIGPNFISGWGIHPTNGISTSPIFYSTKHSTGKTLSKENKIQERLPINIGNDVWIGANCLILDGVKIGNGAIIAAGSIVTKDIESYSIVGGVPAKLIRYRFDENTIKKLEEIQWWNFNEENLKLVEKHFFDLDKFINLDFKI